MDKDKKIICARCDKEFDLNKTYHFCYEHQTGKEIAVCFSCLELIWKNIIKSSKNKDNKLNGYNF